ARRGDGRGPRRKPIGGLKRAGAVAGTGRVEPDRRVIRVGKSVRPRPPRPMRAQLTPAKRRAEHHTGGAVPPGRRQMVGCESRIRRRLEVETAGAGVQRWTVRLTESLEPAANQLHLRLHVMFPRCLRGNSLPNDPFLGPRSASDLNTY